MKLLLELISRHDGEWGWYQLDRAVDVRALPPDQTLMGILEAMEVDGLVETVRLPDRPQAVYRLTKRGRNQLEGHQE